MTALPLLARVTARLRTLPLSISSTRRSGDNGLRNADEVAQAAIAACHAEEMLEALELLCEAKDLKETYGDCANCLTRYWRIMPEPWKVQIHGEIRKAIEVEHAGAECDVRQWKRVLELPLGQAA